MLQLAVEEELYETPATGEASVGRGSVSEQEAAPPLIISRVECGLQGAAGRWA